jgi:hypothetical protein
VSEFNRKLRMYNANRFFKLIFERVINRSIEITRQPGRITWMFLIIRNLVKEKKPNIEAVNRFLNVNRIPPRVLEDQVPPPPISALLVSTQKDFRILEVCLENLKNGSANPIEEITIIVPEINVEECINLLKKLNMGILTKVINEDSILTFELRERIRNKFGSRYGWILQQLLTLSFVLKSEADGILVVDSDTVLMQKLLWLDSQGNQLLMPSWEFNLPYYRFLREISSQIPFAENSYINHHMLMQPLILRTIFEKVGLKSVEDLFAIVEKHADIKVSSPVCLEFEIYAQGILTFFSEKVLITKWSNVSLSAANDYRTTKALHMILARKRYRSVSVHSWSQK